MFFGLLLALAVVATACSDDEDAGERVPIRSDVSAERCLVRLHGRSGTGSVPEERDGYAVVSPTGNDPIDGGFQWLYAEPADLESAIGEVEGWLDEVGCDTVVLNGFSNGGAFAAKLYCEGETFGERVVGVVVDDPVPDRSVVDCAPAEGVDVALYWTGGLTEATAGTPCADLGWTCDGEELLGIEAFAEELGAPVQESPNDRHDWFHDAPELADWLSSGSDRGPVASPQTGD